MAATSLSVRRILPASLRYLRDLWGRREFAWHLARGNLKARNATTALGLLWWVLNPLLLGAIYVVVFGIILKVSRSRDDYVSYLLSGMFAFYYTRSSMVAGVNSIVQNTRLLANLNFPRLILPFSGMVESAYGFVASLAVFYVIVWPIEGTLPGSGIVFLVPIAVIQTLFNFGLAALVARIAVPFRDINNLVPYLLRLWLYLSPIIYSASFLDDRDVPAILRRLLEINPMFPMLGVYRHALIGDPFRGSDLVLSTVWASAVFVIGIASFVRSEGRMARYL